METQRITGKREDHREWREETKQKHSFRMTKVCLAQKWFWASSQTRNC